MSFGYSVGDFILLVQLAHRTFRNCQKAGEEYNEIACEVHNLHSVLRTLQSEAQRPDSKVFKQDASSMKQLIATAEGCKNVLTTLDIILAKYEGLKLEGEAGARKKLWQKLRFGSKTEELGVIRGKLIAYTSTISVLLDIVQIKAADRVESKIDKGFMEIVGRFEKMRKEIYNMASQARAVARNGSTLSLLSLSTYKGDDKEVWQDFQRELINKGFSSQNLDKYKAVLQAYMLKLDQSGILDKENLLQTNQYGNSPSLMRQMHMEMVDSSEDSKIRGSPTPVSGHTLPQHKISSSEKSDALNIDDINELSIGLDEAVPSTKTKSSPTEAWMFGSRIPLIRKELYPMHDANESTNKTRALVTYVPQLSSTEQLKFYSDSEKSQKPVEKTANSPFHPEFIKQRPNEVDRSLVTTSDKRPPTYSVLDLNVGAVTLYAAPDQRLIKDSEGGQRSGVVAVHQKPWHLNMFAGANRITFLTNPEIIGISHFPPPPRELRMISIRCILRPPSISFPEDPYPIFEEVALREVVREPGISYGTRWTKISRKLVSPEALKKGRERYEEKGDFLIVKRVLTRDEIRGYADETKGEEVEAVALFTFDAQDYVDLSFKVGDTITVTKRTESNYDWW
jgi:hypothetical protein